LETALLQRKERVTIASQITPKGTARAVTLIPWEGLKHGTGDHPKSSGAPRCKLSF